MNSEAPSNSADLHRQLRELTQQMLSPVGRYAHVLLLVAAAALGIVVAALLLTEPGLPMKTQAAFGALVVIACAWVVYAAWTLLRRRPLLQAHRVVAGYLASGFSGLFTVVTLVAAIATGASAAWLASGQGVLMFIVALAVLVRARRDRKQLRSRRDALVQALAG